MIIPTLQGQQPKLMCRMFKMCVVGRDWPPRPKVSIPKCRQRAPGQAGILLKQTFQFRTNHQSSSVQMYPKNIFIARLQSLQHVRGAYELLSAMKANKSKEEIMRIYLRYPPLMANFIISRNNYFSCFQLYSKVTCTFFK